MAVANRHVRADAIHILIGDGFLQFDAPAGDMGEQVAARIELEPIGAVERRARSSQDPRRGATTKSYSICDWLP